jgi:hypothetical protein
MSKKKKPYTESQVEALGIKLIPKHKLFVDTWLTNNWNGTQAARAAGYTGTDASLAVTSSRLLKDANIKAYRDAKIKTMHLEADQILQRWAEMGTSDITTLLDKKGQVSLRLARKKGWLIKKIKRHQDGSFEIELHDPQKPLELLAKNLRLLSDTVELTGPDGGLPQFQIIESNPVKKT